VFADVIFGEDKRQPEICLRSQAINMTNVIHLPWTMNLVFMIIHMLNTIACVAVNEMVRLYCYRIVNDNVFASENRRFKEITFRCHIGAIVKVVMKIFWSPVFDSISYALELSQAWAGVSCKYDERDSLAMDHEFSFHDYSHVEHHCSCCSE